MTVVLWLMTIVISVFVILGGYYGLRPKSAKIVRNEVVEDTWFKDRLEAKRQKNVLELYAWSSQYDSLVNSCVVKSVYEPYRPNGYSLTAAYPTHLTGRCSCDKVEKRTLDGKVRRVDRMTDPECKMHGVPIVPAEREMISR